jgi:hypothetical protein
LLLTLSRTVLLGLTSSCPTLGVYWPRPLPMAILSCSDDE